MAYPKLVLGILFALSAYSAAAATYAFSIDTSAVAGTTGFVDFKFNPGNPASQPATIQLLNFDRNSGTPNGAPALIGDVNGSLPGVLTFGNTTALNEYLQSFTYRTQISFNIVITGPAIDTSDGTPPAGSTFGVTLYDGTKTPILTNQASGFVAEVDINPDGSATYTAFPAGASVAIVAGPVDYSYQVAYIANISRGDGVIDITNAGSLGAAPPGPAIGTTGRICVNVYAFSPDEQEIACCSCLVTPNAVVHLTALADLIPNTLTLNSPESIVVKLLSTIPGAGTGNFTGSPGTQAGPFTGSSCNAAFPFAPTNLTPGLRAWATAVHALPTTPVSYGQTEAEFQPAYLSPGELAKLTGLCQFIVGNGSGAGICHSCHLSGL